MKKTLDSNWFTPFCGYGDNPLTITEVLVTWLRSHFSDARRFDNDKPNEAIVNFVWKPGKDTGIIIESASRWVPTATEHRPALIVKRNAWKRLKLGIGDRRLGDGDTESLVPYETAWDGSHTIFCITNNGPDTELLAVEVFKELVEFSQIVRSLLNLRYLSVQEVGELSLLEEARENFVVPITISYGYNSVWTVKKPDNWVVRIQQIKFNNE